MARPSNTLQRRAEIVDGLLTVMTTRGYEGATIPAIGKAAGLAPGLVHYHFDSKAEVLLALVERLIAQVRARFAARPGDRLDAFIDAHLALGRDADPRAAAAWSIIGAEALRQPDVRRLYRHALASSLKELKHLVAGRLKRNGKPTRNAGRVAAAVISAIEGAFRIAAAAPGALPRGYAAPMVRRMAESLVRAE